MDGIKDKLRTYFQPQRFWLNIFFLVALIVIILINIFSLRQLNTFTLANRRVFHSYQVIQAANQILLTHLNAVSVTRGYLLTGDENFLGNFEPIINEMNQNLSRLRGLTKDNVHQQKKISKLSTLIAQRTDVLKKSIVLKRMQKVESAEEKSLIYLGQTITDKIQSVIEEIYETELNLLHQRNISTENNAQRALNFAILMNAISMLFLLTIIILFNRRLTEHVQLEAERHRSETLLKGIINGTNDYIAAVDLNLNYLTFNRTFEEEFKRIFGKKPMIGMSVKESLELVPHNIEPILALWTRAIRGEEFSIIDKFGNKNSSNNEYEVTFSAIYDEHNNLIGASHIARNVTQRITQEKALKLAKQDIELSYRDLKKHDDELSIINEMNGALQSASSLTETLDMVKNYCQRLLSFTKGVLYIMNASRNYLESLADWNDPDVPDQILLPEQCWGLRQGKIYQYFGHAGKLPCKHAMIAEEVKPYVCVPLLAQNNIIGLLFLQMKDAGNVSMERLTQQIAENEFLIENIAGHISLAIANMKLQEALKIRSIRDSLTGLYNRSYMDESLYRDIDRANRKNISLAVIMIDLDHFKSINDTFGHEAGDLVLVEVAKLLMSHTRRSDIVCRYGGEEFLMTLYDVSEEEAFERCEQIRKAIRDVNIFFGETLISRITASFGIAMYPKVSDDWQRLIRAADEALYHSKNSGRNRITLYTP